VNPGYDRCVFINCPFDRQYQRLFAAIIFTVHECGFFARCAREAEDSGEERIRKIKRIIRECGYGVHDISRVQLDPASGLPRFNMPLELGLYLGAQEYGTGVQKEKRSLVLDTEDFRYQKFCSDIAGQDIRAHGNRPAGVIRAVRRMLATAAGGMARIPGEAKIAQRYAQFRAELPQLAKGLHAKPPELQFVELRTLAAEWVKDNPLV
jgi:hypothetical protein